VHCAVVTEHSVTPMSEMGSDSHQQTAVNLSSLPGPPAAAANGGTDGDVTRCRVLV